MDKEKDKDIYIALAKHTPYDVGIGGAIITMIEPHLGHEIEYNRWYEDDHFYAGVMAGPWCFTGKRYLAPKSLREKRFPATSPVAQPLDKGIFISVYFILAGHVEDNFKWTNSAMYDVLKPMGRAYDHRDHVFTAQHHYAFEVLMDPPPMQSYHALDHPYKGMVLEVIQANEGVSRQDLIPWLRDEFIPGQAQKSGQCIGFLPKKAQLAAFGNKEGVRMGACISILWFLTTDPMTDMPEHFATHEKQLDQHGKATLLLVSPFIPTVPGTNLWANQLR